MLVPSADCSVGPSGSLTFHIHADGRLPQPAELLLQRQSGTRPGAGGNTEPLRIALRPAEHDLAGRPVPEGTRLAGTLGHLDGPLPDGRWNVLLRLPGQEPQHLPGGGLLDTRHLIGQDQPALPLRIRLPYQTADGFLAVRPWQRTRHAEVGDVTASGDGTLTVAARIFGAAGQDAPTLEARCRDNGGPPPVVARAQRTAESAANRESCRLVLPLAELARASAGSVWDLRMTGVGGGQPVRLGRILDDIHDKKRVLRLPRRAYRAGG